MKSRLRASFVVVLASLTACEDEGATENPPRPEPVASSTHAQPHENPPAPETAQPTRNPPAPRLSEGDLAPEVTLSLQDGEKVKLSELKDDIVLVYFYPKDDTPGCTVEAQGLRDRHEELSKAGVKVFGVSLQDAASHQAFIEKHDLPFPLAVGDPALAGAFDVPVKKGEYAARHSFLLHDGKIAKVWREVDPAEHAAEVLRAAQRLGDERAAPK